MVSGGDGGGSAPSGPLQVNPADIPALEVKLGALVLLLCVTLLFGFAPLWLVRWAGPCRAGPGESQVRPGPLSGVEADLSCHCRQGSPDVESDQLFRGRGLPGHVSAGSAAGLPAEHRLRLQGRRDHGRLRRRTGSCGAALTPASQLQFPLPEFLVSTGVLLVLVLEQTVLAFSERPSSGSEQRQALLTGSSIPEDAAPPPTSALRSFLLLLSLSLHSASEGLAVGLLEDGRKVLELCLALSVHRSLLAFSLALRLAQGRLRRPLVASCLLLFAAMSPLGIGVGMGLTHVSPQHRLARSTLEGLAAGTFIYITFMEILPQELHSASARIPKVAALLGGFTAVTAVLFIKL